MVPSGGHAIPPDDFLFLSPRIGRAAVPRFFTRPRPSDSFPRGKHSEGEGNAAPNVLLENARAACSSRAASVDFRRRYAQRHPIYIADFLDSGFYFFFCGKKARRQKTHTDLAEKFFGRRAAITAGVLFSISISTSTAERARPRPGAALGGGGDPSIRNHVPTDRAPFPTPRFFATDRRGHDISAARKETAQKSPVLH